MKTLVQLKWEDLKEIRTWGHTESYSQRGTEFRVFVLHVSKDNFTIISVVKPVHVLHCEMAYLFSYIKICGITVSEVHYDI